MKKNQRLGEVARATREVRGLSQRELGRLVGVTSSHVACIEAGKRRPSHSLLFRLARALKLNRRELFLLAYPEVTPAILSLPPAANREASWRQFVAVSGRYSVTPKELIVLRKISRLGKISPNAYFYILNSIRQSLEID